MQPAAFGFVKGSQPLEICDLRTGLPGFLAGIQTPDNHRHTAEYFYIGRIAKAQNFRPGPRASMNNEHVVLEAAGSAQSRAVSEFDHI